MGTFFRGSQFAAAAWPATAHRLLLLMLLCPCALRPVLRVLWLRLCSFEVVEVTESCRRRARCGGCGQGYEVPLCFLLLDWRDAPANLSFQYQSGKEYCERSVTV
jgi:hypothetical protein